MEVTLTKTGGLVGIHQRIHFNTNDLCNTHYDEFMNILRNSDFFCLKESKKRGGFDMFNYTLKIGDKTISFDDSNINEIPGIISLVNWIENWHECTN